jgi:O-methyltransferase
MPSTAERYLELLKKSLLNELYIENEARLQYLIQSMVTQSPVDTNVVRDIARHRTELIRDLLAARAEGQFTFRWNLRFGDGSVRPVDLRNVTEFYHTMIGRKRLDNIHMALDHVVRHDIAGDVIETGVWRGGATIFMRGYLAAHNIVDRTVWVADSFAGLPPPTMAQDAGHDYSAAVAPILAISRAEVEDLFRRYDLLDGQVKFLEGWFKDTLPAAPIEKLAILRLDGDLYESTSDALNALYDKVSPGGFVIVDDYHDIDPCKQAVEDFRTRRGISDPIIDIDWSGAYWRKATR